MRSYSLVGMTFSTLLAICSAGTALAQGAAAICSQIRSELATVDRSSGPSEQSRREAGRLRGELARVQNALQANECNNRGFFSFGGQAPVCAPLRAQAGQINARLQQLGGSGGGNPRRAQLVAALDRYGCNAPAPQPQQARGAIYANPNDGSLFDRLFGRGTEAIVNEQRPPLDANLDQELNEKVRLGGRTAVCVRTCDGYFFPVNYEGLTARDEHGSVCSALCPGADTQVFYMRLGAEIETAATRDGRPYSALPTARAYQEKRDDACFCKPVHVTWAQATKGAEDIVEARKGDVILTSEQAAAMARPKELRTGDGTARNRRNTRTPEPAPVADIAPPTAGTASSGIASRAAPNVPPVQGTVQDIVGPDGSRRQVRVVAPGLAGQ